MVLSPLCPTYLNVRPSGNPPTQDHMLSHAAQAILNVEKLRMETERREKEQREEEWDAWERQRMYYRSLDNAPTYNDSDPAYKPWRGCHMQD